MQKILNRNRKIERTVLSGEDLRDICRREFRRDSTLKDRKVGRAIDRLIESESHTAELIYRVELSLA